MSYNDFVPKASLGSINVGLSSASEETMVQILGQPKGELSETCNDNLASDIVLRLKETRHFGNFQATGIKPALDSLSAIIDKLKVEKPNLYNVVGAPGMLCVRLRRPTSGIHSSKASNHSWGTAIDISISGKVDTRPDGLVQQGIAELIPYFNGQGWFSGVGFRNAEDDTHFEIADETKAVLDSFLEAHDVGEACNALSDARVAFYTSISEPGSKNAKYRSGWLNRANWFRTSNAEWWSKWKSWTMPIPTGSSKPLGLTS